MRIEKKNANEERRILIGMIVDSIVLARIGAKWQGNMFRSRWANIIAKWCLDYHKKYEEAPLGQIEGLYESWADKSKDKELITLVDKFLNSLSEEYEELKEESNSDYIIDVAGIYFNKVQIEQLMEHLEGDLDVSDVEGATAKLTSYNQVEMGVGAGIDVLHDREAMQEAFEEKQQGLIPYHGALGKFFGNAFGRDCFVSFMGPEGRGKSFWLQDVAYRALLARKKVVFFTVGDMSQNQIMRRFLIRIAKCPLYPKVIDYPVLIGEDDDEDIEVEFEEKRFREKLNWKVSYKACKKLMKRKVKSKQSYLKLSCHPNSTLSVSGIHSLLQSWSLIDWVPDVIVIDYADILNMDKHGVEGRDRINETWKQLRGLSQIYHCLVVTATQSDADSYDTTLIRRRNFSEDKRKFAHVTGMVGLNQLEEEKGMGLFRLNWLKLRDEDYRESRCVYVAGCLALANPAVRSYLRGNYE